MADPTSGALNPYALAEIILKRPIDWANTPNALQLLADTLGTPADELFDPSFKCRPARWPRSRRRPS